MPRHRLLGCVALGVLASCAESSTETSSVSESTLDHGTVATPYHGTPATVPGTIQAEDFDLGGSGTAFLHTKYANEPTQVAYRTDEASVHVGPCTSGSASCGHRVGYVSAGDWLGYTINVKTAGTYAASIMIANANPGAKTIHFEVDGLNVTGPITLPATATWATWAPATTSLKLEAGTHFLKLVAETAVEDFDYFTIGENAAGGTPAGRTAAGVGTGGTSTPQNVAVTGAGGAPPTTGLSAATCGAVGDGSTDDTSAINACAAKAAAQGIALLIPDRSVFRWGWNFLQRSS